MASRSPVATKRIARSPRLSTLYIGVDEAGYGPNLGPLVIAGVAFRADADWVKHDWWERMGPLVSRDGSGGCPIDDSKTILGRPDGFARLAATVHAFLAAVEHDGFSIRDLFGRLAPVDLVEASSEPWFEANEAGIGSRGNGVHGVQAAMEARGVAFLDARARVLTAAPFNAGLDRLGSKAAVEAEALFPLLADLLECAAPNESVHVWVDRLGGRKFYREFVEELAGDTLVFTTLESPERSSYRFDRDGREVSVSFRVKGDQIHLPIALASMFAKYLRERMMEDFNCFWRRHSPDLAPTAGYPHDAKRFLEEIEPIRAKLGIPIERLWRRK